MRRTFANSGFALTLRRRLGRRRAGTPAILVRTRSPLWWRLICVGGSLLAVSVLGFWTYDAGRRFSGFENSESVRELAILRARVGALSEDTTTLRATADSSASSLQIEKTAQERLARKIGELEAENAHLKQELAFFDSLAEGTPNGAPISINRFDVLPEAESGGYRYRLLVVLQGGKLREFSGTVQLVISYQGQAGPTKIVLPRAEDPDRQRFRIHFRHFRRVDGTFRIPQTATLTRVEVRLIQDGTTKASRSLTL